MDNKILIFDDPEEFIQVIEMLQDEYNKKHELKQYEYNKEHDLK